MMKFEYFIVGRLLCGSFRNALNRMKQSGYKIDFEEGKGVLERQFKVYGDDEDMDFILLQLKRFL